MLEVRDLVWRAAMQIGAPGAQHWHICRHGARGRDGTDRALIAQLDQAELDIIHREGFLCLGVEALERLGGVLDL